MTTTFQPMPDLTEEEYAALREDIRARGVMVPAIVDQHGRTLDGHNRQRIAKELGVVCPVEVREVEDDEAAMSLALSLNLTRRHLNREQRRQIIRNELRRCEFRDSDRAIGRRVGADHKTVGSVRAQMKEEAEASTERARQAMRDGFQALFREIIDLLTKGANLDNAISLAEQVRDDSRSGAIRQVETREEFTEDIPALINHYVYGGIHTELTVLRDSLLEQGWSQENMPPPSAEVGAAMAMLFAGVGNFPTSKTETPADSLRTDDV